MKIQKNILLASYTTFRIGGPARYFIIAKKIQDLIEAIKFARRKLLPYFILAGGSNLLVSDKGFDGVVIKIQNTKHKIQDTKIIVEAGVKLNDLVKISAEAGLTGLEWAIDIPGTVGGAIRGNAGAFGRSISEFIREVETLNSKIQDTRYRIQDIKFGYRDSVFKKNKEIILSAVLKLEKDNPEKVRNKLKDYNKKRNIPSFPSAGCVFKNLLIKNLNKKILAMIPEDKIKERKIAAGYLIDQCGLKGKKIGQAMISEKHANFIVNLGGAKASEVVRLIQLIKKTVQKKFNLELKEEIEYLGFD